MTTPTEPDPPTSETDDTSVVRWSYVPDEDPKRKHHWDKNQAGFVEVNGILIGKCPSEMTMAEAERLLNNGIAWRPKGWKKAHPKRIYHIHQGVVYRATPTIPGQSYHGFPENASGLPPELKKPLVNLAKQLGCLEEVEKWLKG